MMRPSFPVSELDYELPVELIAQEPPARREDARLLRMERASGRISDGAIPQLPDWLRPGDLLVVNNTKVLPAKLVFRRATGGRVEGLFLEEIAGGEWLVMLEGAKRLRGGERVTAEGRSGRIFELSVSERLEGGRCRVRVEPAEPAGTMLGDIGLTPLPPYVRRSARRPAEPVEADEADRERYQTVYAKQPGAVAAPTAGFHLCESILERIRARGVGLAEVTLHVGMGTFQPIAVDDLALHPMHAERYELSLEAAEAINRCKTNGGRVVAVGTTTVRVLESAAASSGTDVSLKPSRGSTDLLLYPPCEFRVVSALLTNFHLPRSTLLALVMAFAGVELTRRAYAHAIARAYRFYSFGDAMFIE